MKVQFNKKTIIIVLIIVAVIVGLVFFIKWQKEKPIRIVKEFINAAQKEDIKTLEKLFDTKGFFAWEECDEDIDDFKEEYEKIDDNELKDMVKDYTGHDNIKEVCSSLVSEIDYINYTSDESVEISISGEPKMEKIAPNMYEITVKLKAEGYSTEKMKFIVYKNKIIHDEWC